jgi:hypothetical protein
VIEGGVDAADLDRRIDLAMRVRRLADIDRPVADVMRRQAGEARTGR